ncbi:NHL-repeat-containing protein 4 [Bufo gargarizans]|uniref:NHL-repeat-containing protein 4 n=1 Tax=Bufo gargarizans TaxID=30331 RepID=UPI001CF23B1B|nr:NHL-repeat-containing protein 4 [Bufo gargarizans]
MDSSLEFSRQKEDLVRTVRSLQVASQNTLQKTIPLLSSHPGLGLLKPSHVQQLSKKTTQVCRDLEDVGNLILFRQDELTQKISVPGKGGVSSLHWCSDGTLYVGGDSGPYIHLLNSHGKPTQTFHCYDDVPFFPDSAAVTRFGALAVTDIAEGILRIYSPNSHPPWIKVGGHFKSPKGIAMDSSGRILVAEYTSGEVQAFHMDRAHRIHGVKKVSGLQGPQYICSTPDGGFAVSEECRDVKLFTSNLKLAGSLSETYRHEFGNPSGICSDPEGNVLVADVQKRNITLFPPSGSPICIVSQGLSEPVGIACSPFGLLYVGDTGDNCVKVFKYRAKPYYTPTSPRRSGEAPS